MKYCIITPTKYINDPKIGWQSDFLLVLSHLLNIQCDNEYAKQVKEFQRTWKKLYLDNWLFENWEPEDAENLIIKAMLLEVDVIFCPDHLYDNKKTQEAFEEFSILATSYWYKWKLAYVVQADNLMTYCLWFKWALKNEKVDMIAMSILSITKSVWEKDKVEITKSRQIMMEMLDFYLDINKPVHLLWLWESLQDLIDVKQYSWIVSNDSCSAFMTWMYNKTYNQDLQIPGWKIKEKVDFNYDWILSTSQLACILKNISMIKDVI